MARALALAAALASLPAAGCLRATAFTCSDSAACGDTGRCESTGYCSVPDPACNGNRYVSAAGPYAGQCVGTSAIDAPGSGSGSGSDGPANCPGDFAPVSGSAHVYKAIAAGNWAAQVAACTALSPNAYLAIPDDGTELGALATLQTPPAWVGISRANGGSPFRTVKGVVATFLPWMGGAPAGGKDCVAMVNAGELQTDSCNSAKPAVCECEP